ncbi:DUF6814 family protein [Paenimyroides baculatum]|uniref:Uncharacterized protein n=1 Tax=Paenimyroides baculatum TaxID=2608000 RepID=A0A5M6CA86_9FLAO|nr:hypothetical protein [Paenimyroides baculatum]KAA5532058.1 hypothetical protein F0460_13685 [Paenimyroides baculatum]
MEAIKRILGIVWILLGVVTAYLMIQFGYPRLISGTQDGVVFGIIILFVLMPLITLGLIVFGYYALCNEYSDKKL